MAVKLAPPRPPMKPYRPRFETSRVVIWRATCHSWLARSTIVHESWSVDHAATETRKGSDAVMAQIADGSGQDGDISVGFVDTTTLEKTDASFE